MRSLTILFILSLSYQALSHTSWKATHKTKNCFYELRFATNDTTYSHTDGNHGVVDATLQQSCDYGDKHARGRQHVAAARGGRGTQ